MAHEGRVVEMKKKGCLVKLDKTKGMKKIVGRNKKKKGGEGRRREKEETFRKFCFVAIFNSDFCQ